MSKGIKEYKLWQKISFTIIIFSIYILGQFIPLYGIDQVWYSEINKEAEHFLKLILGGDVYKISVLSLGISPYISSSIIMMIYTVIRRTVSKSKFSMVKIEKIHYILAMIFATIQAIFTVEGMHFKYSNTPLMLLKIIATLELIFGAIIIIILIKFNKDYGIGGQSLFIIINLSGSIILTVSNLNVEELVFPIICGLIAMIITLIMENAEFRIPVQRIFIYNIYKDKNYIAIKYNPVGIMPVMFSTSVFSLLQLLLNMLNRWFPESYFLNRLVDFISLSNPIGIIIYVVIIYLLTIVLAIFLLNPSEISRNLLESNDSICNVCSGKPTKRYLMKVVITISLISATLMGSIIGGALVLQMQGLVTSDLVMMPSLIMMLTSILVSLSREIKTAIVYESYRVFL